MKIQTLLLSLIFVVLSVSGMGCGHHATQPGSGDASVIYQSEQNGWQGYYLLGQWCDWTSNYCGTGDSMGIVVPAIFTRNGEYGYYNVGMWCNWSNNYCGSG